MALVSMAYSCSKLMRYCAFKAHKTFFFLKDKFLALPILVCKIQTLQTKFVEGQANGSKK